MATFTMASLKDDCYYDLGSYRRLVTANTEDAQLWFSRGLIWCYGFNHEEAAECFKQAIVSDAQCVMAYWGLAYALGPNYNKPWDFFDDRELESTVDRTHTAVMQAEKLAGRASPVEGALVHALQSRYPQQKPESTEGCNVWNKDYAAAMEKVYADYPDDLDVAVLCADALMNLTPWQLWDVKTGNPAEGARTVTIRHILERALAQEGAMQHPGLLHLYIHLMEMSQTPEAALVAADHLRGLVPDSGHLNHMPSHIDVLLGNYNQSIASNQAAIVVDEKYLERTGALNFYTLYRNHDYHFCIYSAMFAGQSRVALEAVAQLETSIPDKLLRVESPPMADWLEGFLAMRVHALIRFGRWADLINLAIPEDQELYCVTTAMTHYGKAVAYAATKHIDLAQNERESFAEAQKKVPESRMLFNNKCVDILKIAEGMMQGELDYRRGAYDSAFANLRLAIERDDTLPYDEPWGWMQPTRHAYGALLLEQGKVEEALVVYAEDLGLDGAGVEGVRRLPRAMRHPWNVWSLHGYHECLVKTGRREEASDIWPDLQRALAGADVPVEASCFCRLSALL